MTSVPQERKLVTAIPGPKSQELHQRTKGAVSAGVGIGLPVYVERAGGGILVDVDGNQLIDFGSGIAVTNVGNGNPAVVKAVQQQVERFTHTCFMVTPYEGYVAACERLAELTPGDHEKRSALFNSGAEAVENAVKIARHATGRSAVVASRRARAASNSGESASQARTHAFARSRVTWSVISTVWARPWRAICTTCGVSVTGRLPVGHGGQRPYRRPSLWTFAGPPIPRPHR